MAKVIEFDLSSAGLTKAIKEIRQAKKDFLDTCTKLVKQLMDLGVLEGQTQISLFEFKGSPQELINGMKKGAYNEKTRSGIVYNDVYYAVFVEYGTGLVGKSQSYTGEFMPASVTAKGKVYSSYDQGGYGEDGWWYVDEKTGKLRWTMGQPSRPFFYNMYRQLKAKAPGVAKAVFGEWL